MKRHLILFAATLLLLASCRGETQSTDTTSTTTETLTAPAETADQAFTLYSGRNEKLIRPLLDRFTQETGIRVEARFGESAELAATLMEEGERTPADVYFSQDAAGLGAVAKAGLTRALPQEMVAKVPSRFAGPDGQWVGVSGRARTVVYDSTKIRPEQLPQSLEDVASPRYRGTFGIAPLNASFQSQMAVYHALHGAEALDRLLQGIAANEPRRYARNGAIVDAVASGEIQWGLVNHYYAWEAKKSRPELRVENFFMPKGDASSFVNVAGVALMSGDPDALLFVQYLLSEPAQRYFAEQTFEYPLVAGVPASVALQPLEELRTPDIDFSRVADSLPQALAKIGESGLNRQ